MGRLSVLSHYPITLWIVWTVLLHNAQNIGAFYHLTSPLHPCHVMSHENSTVDLICQYQEGFMTSLQGSTRHCTTQKVVWQRSDYNLATNITDTAKYGIWEAVPGWKMREGQRLSLLRIRTLQNEDLGLYQCRIQCREADGRIHTEHHMADLCLKHGDTAYSECSVRAMENKCSWSFGNGICDPECDTEENLYDGFDCALSISDCKSQDEQSCKRSFANGVCDNRCSSSSCMWDGGDCIDKPLNFAEDVIVLTLARWYYLAGNTVDIKFLGRTLSKLLRTIIRVMPEDWHPGPSPRSSASPRVATWHRPASDRVMYVNRMTFYLKIDNTMCRRRCFSSAEYAAKFIDMYLKSKWDPGIPISSVGVLAKTSNQCSLENNTLLHIDLPISSLKGSETANIYSYTYPDENDSSPPTWLLVTAIFGGLVILVLLLVIIVIIFRIRKMSKEEQRQPTPETIRIQDKNSPQGTDV